MLISTIASGVLPRDLTSKTAASILDVALLRAAEGQAGRTWTRLNALVGLSDVNSDPPSHHAQVCPARADEARNIAWYAGNPRPSGGGPPGASRSYRDCRVPSACPFRAASGITQIAAVPIATALQPWLAEPAQLRRFRLPTCWQASELVVDDRLGGDVSHRVDDLLGVLLRAIPLVLGLTLTQRKADPKDLSPLGGPADLDAHLAKSLGTVRGAQAGRSQEPDDKSIGELVSERGVSRCE